MTAPKNILVIRLNSIGDVVLTLPALSALRANFPAAEITFLTRAENSPLLRGFRDVNHAILLKRSAGNPFRMAGDLFRLIREIRAAKFDCAIDFQGNGESGWLTRLTGAPQRWGIVYRATRRWVYTRSVERSLEIHAAEMHLQLLEKCGVKTGSVRNEFFLPADALAAAGQFLAQNKIAGEKPRLFIQPFTSTEDKDWPLENYLALARHWRAGGGEVVFGGGPAEREKLEPARAAGFAVSAGVPLLVTGGLMQLSALVIGGDTGALHLATAQGRRVVMIMNNHRPNRPHPFRHADWALLPPIDRRIASITLPTVIAACEQARTENALPKPPA
jgi:ADP-heptose:LPS heptosyltransferase